MCKCQITPGTPAKRTKNAITLYSVCFVPPWESADAGISAAGFTFMPPFSKDLMIFNFVSFNNFVSSLNTSMSTPLHSSMPKSTVACLSSSLIWKLNTAFILLKIWLKSWNKCCKGTAKKELEKDFAENFSFLTFRPRKPRHDNSCHPTIRRETPEKDTRTSLFSGLCSGCP